MWVRIKGVCIAYYSFLSFREEERTFMKQYFQVNWLEFTILNSFLQSFCSTYRTPYYKRTILNVSLFYQANLIKPAPIISTPSNNILTQIVYVVLRGVELRSTQVRSVTCAAEFYFHKQGVMHSIPVVIQLDSYFELCLRGISHLLFQTSNILCRSR